MKRSAEDAAATRRAILRAASRAFRARGAGSTSIADVMSSIGLTVGGFYRHFDDKDALLEEAMAFASAETSAAMGKASAGARPSRKLEAVAAHYLSRSHRHNAGHGCPLTTLAEDARHGDASIRRAFAAAFERVVGALEETGLSRPRALSAVAALAGAVTLARALADERAADELCDAVYESITKS